MGYGSLCLEILFLLKILVISQVFNPSNTLIRSCYFPVMQFLHFTFIFMITWLKSSLTSLISVRELVYGLLTITFQHLEIYLAD